MRETNSTIDWQQENGKSNETLFNKFPSQHNEAWAVVARTRKYTPTDDDIGRPLCLEVAPFVPAGVDPHHPNQVRLLYGERTRRITEPVQNMPPPPPPRQMRGVNPSSPTARQPFTVFNYNVLAQLLATQRMYPYTKAWALAWAYRKKLILRDILQHHSDIIALQEVQANHYESFFRPELARRGYKGVYKRKTRVATGDDKNLIDGCALFFRTERYSLREQYAIEFDDLARQHFKRRALRRLIKGNVGLFVVLDDHAHLGGPKQICVANVHTYWNPEFADVKLWQTWMLCLKLQKLVEARSLPLLLCGDFNSMPDSAVYELLATGHVAPENPIFNSSNDPEGVLPPDVARLSQGLGLRSVYHSIMQREPVTTNFTEKFSGVLDYVWFSQQHLVPMGCLDVDDIHVLREHTALPSPMYPSDHISLVCQLDWAI
jgi:CCR4-NOT transcription complex subunit 6